MNKKEIVLAGLETSFNTKLALVDYSAEFIPTAASANAESTIETPKVNIFELLKLNSPALKMLTAKINEVPIQDDGNSTWVQIDPYYGMGKVTSGFNTGYYGYTMPDYIQQVWFYEKISDLATNFTLNSDGTLHFTPTANYNGDTSFTYTVTSGGTTETATVNVTVNAIPDGFTDEDELISVNEDTTLNGTVLTGTSSVDGPVTVTQFTIDGVTYSAGQTATVIGIGSLQINVNGTYTFIPTANYNGPVPVATYTLTDGSSTDTSTLTITVNSVNDPVIDANEMVAVNEDTSLNGSVLTGTASGDGPVSVTDFTINGTNYTAGQTATLSGIGSLLINTDGTYTFIPEANYNGPVPVATYALTDGDSTDTSTLTITVNPVNDPLTDGDEELTLFEDTSFNGTVLNGTSSVDGPVTVVDFNINAETYTAGQTATLAGIGSLVINTDGSYTFIPVANYNGPVPVATYTLTDGDSTDISTLTITINPVNDPFTDADEVASVDEDTTLNGTVLSGTSSVDGPVTVTEFSVDGANYTAGQTAALTGVGALQINANGTYSFIPVANYHGPVPVATYTLSDGDSTDTSTLTITVNPVNDPFTDANEVVSVDEDTTLNGTVLNGTSSGDGPVTVTDFTIDGTSYTAGQTATLTGVGSLIINTDGTYTFIPVANFNGSVPVATYTLTDGDSTDTSTLTITVNPINDAFTDANEVVSVDEDTTLNGTVLNGTSSVDGPVTIVDFTIDSATYTAGQTATISGVGTLQINVDGTYTYIPAANYNGPVPSVTYTVTDGDSTDTSTLAITVTPVNDPFTDADEIVSVDEDTTLNGTVLNGTSSGDGPVTITDFTIDSTNYTAGQTATLTGIGSLVINADGSYTFIPVANFNGPVPVATYALTDGDSTDTSTLTITVNPTNDAFTDANEVVSVDEDTTLNGTVLSGTGSVDGPVTITEFTVSGTTYNAGQTATLAGIGTLQINVDGTYTYIPAANYNGPVPVATYTLTDGDSTDTSTLAITVAPINDAFSDADEIVSVDEDSVLNDTVLAGTSSGDGPVTVTDFTVSGTTYTAGQTATLAGIGTLQINADGAYTFIPTANYNGPVPVVTYSLTDGDSTDTSTLTINVTPVNDEFTDANEVVSVNEDTTLNGTVLTGTSSIDGPVTVTQFTIDSASYAAGQTATLSGIGSLMIDTDGSYTFIPVANFNGSVPVATYTLTDGDSTDTSTLTITVNPINDAFTDENELVSVDEDTILNGTVLDGTSSPDGPVTVTSFTINGVSYPAGQTATIAGVGSLAINIDGSYTFTPEANYNGLVPTALYTLTDGDTSDISSLTITVNPVNDAFADADEVVFMDEDTILNGSVLTGTASGDGPVSVTDFTINGTNYTAGQTATLSGIGSLLINTDGTYTFIPETNYNGPVPVATYALTDGDSTDTSTLTITINPVNDPFTDADEIVAVDEDTTLNGTVLSGTSSVDGPVTLTDFTISGITYNAGQTATLAGVGTLQINANGSYSFIPAANYNGPVPVTTYTLTDGDSTNTSTLTITINPVNDPFTDADEVASVDEDTTLNGTVLSGTSSVDGPVTVTEFSVDGANYTAGQTAALTGVGALQINANGTYSFIPVANYHGPVPVATYTLSDGDSTDTSTLTITVNPVNDPFTDANEVVSVDEDTTLNGTVLNGTSSGDGPVTVTDFTIDGTSYTAGQTATLTGVGSLIINADGTYTFIPAANFNGSVPVATYTLTDGNSTDTSTLTITVNPINDAFTDENEVISVDEDTTLNGSVLNGTSSGDGPVTVVDFTIDGATYAAGQTATLAGIGSLVINADGNYTFIPTTNYNGTVPVALYTLTDGDSSDISSLAITVNPANDPFIDADETVSVDEDSTLNGTVLSGTSSVDGPVTVTDFTIDGTNYIAGQTATITGIGTLQINANGSYSFIPAANYNGPVPVATYTLTDGDSSDTSTLTITVTPVGDDSLNDADEIVTVDEDTTLNDSVLNGTTSVDGPVTVTTFTVDGTTYNAGDTAAISGIGTLQINTDGTYTFIPEENYNGSVPAVTYNVTDGVNTDTSTLTITVNPVNDDFIDANELVAVDEDTILNGTVLNGTSSVDGPVTVTDFTVDGVNYTAGQTAAIVGVGGLQINANGTYSFIPVANYNGPVPVATYTLTDGDSTDTSTLTITVNPVDDAFTDADEVVFVNEDTTLNGTVLSGTSSVDGPVTVTEFTVSGITYNAGQTATLAGVGTLQINADGNYTFIPAANYNGAVPVVSYTLTDGDSNDTSTLTITVDPINDAFTDANEVVSVDEDTTLNGSVLNGTSSGDGPVTVVDFTIDGATYAAGQTATLTGIGSLVINDDGNYTFIPAPNYYGPVPQVLYTVTDGDSSDISSLTITVNPVDDPFADADETVSVNEDTTLNDTVLSGTSSVDGPVTVTDFTIDGANYTAGQTATITGIGTLQINPNGTYTFIPDANYNGPVPVATYTLTDGDTSDTSTLTITVDPVNDDFIDADELVSVDEDTTLNDTVLAGTTSIDGPVTVIDFTIDGATYTSGQTATLTGIGSLVINADGTYTFTPTAHYNGPVPVATYTLTDGDSTNTSTLTITVNPVSDDFTDADEVVSVNEDSILNGSVLTGTSSVDGPVTVTDFTVDGVNYTAGQTAALVGIGALQINANGTYSFIPVANYNGPVPVATYTLTDGDSTDTSTLTITVNPVDDAFTDADEVVSVNEDTTLNGTVLSGTNSVDGPVTVTEFTVSGITYNAGQTALMAGVGSMQINANGNYTFIPAPNYNGPVPVVTYTVTDGDSTDTSTLTITVNPVDDAFTDANEVITVNEDTILNGTVLSGTGSVDGPVTVTDFTINGTNYAAGQTATITGIGSLVINTNGTYTFIPATNYNGPVPVVTYALTDGDSTDTSTLTITVNPVDDAFTDADEVVSVNEDTTLNGTVLTGTTSVDGPVTVTGFSIDGTNYTAGQTATLAGVGSLIINADGTYTFIPETNYNGPVPVATYTLTDGDSTDTSTLTITVNPVDDAFTDADELVSVNEDTTLNGTVLTGTTSVDGPVTVTDFTIDGANYTAGQTATITGIGIVQINANGTYTFIPAANYNGPVPVATYTLTDGDSTDTSTLTITVTPVNDIFTDADEIVSVDEDTTLNGTVLTGTTSVDGPVTITDFSIDGANYTAGQTATLAGIGSLVINADGTYTFTPAANYNGPVPAATYTLTDGDSTDTSTLTITVNPVNDAFTDDDEIVSVDEDTTLNGSVLNGTSSVDGLVTVTDFTIDGANYTAGQTATLAGIGSLIINTDGTYTFTPETNYNGPVPAALYTLTDGDSSDVSTLTITVNPVDDAFIDADEVVSVNEDTTLNGTVLSGTSSVDGPVTVTDFTIDGANYTAGQTATLAGVGSLVINSDGTYTFTPAANYNGSIPVATYTLTDGDSTDTSTLTITVNPVNDDFIDADEVVSVDEDTTLNGTVLSGTSSVDGPVTVTDFTISGITYNAGQTATLAGVGSLLINADGNYTFIPTANYNGSVPVATYTLTDGDSTDTSTLTITVNPVDDAFTDANEVVSVNEDTTLNGSVLNGTSSLDGPVTVTDFTISSTTYAAGQTAMLAGVGSLVINVDGSYTFIPAANYNGPVPVATYTLTDGDSSDTSTLTITVNPVNDAFTDANEVVSVNEDTTLNGTVLSGTSSVDGPVTVTDFTIDGSSYTAGQTATLTGIGSLVINADGTYTFIPTANYNGSVPIATYTLTDGDSTDTSTLTITVTPVNDAFTDADEVISVDEDTTLNGSVLSGTTSGDGPVTVTDFTINGTTYSAGQTATLAGIGSLVINVDGTYTFTPAANYNGAVPTALYTLTDGDSTDISTLTITVNPVNDAFTDADEVVLMDEDTTLNGTVLSGTSSVDGPVSVTDFTIDGTNYTAGQTATLTGIGTLQINANGSYTFIPVANYNGPVPVATYNLTDGDSTDTSTLTITVTPVSDDSLADADETVSVNEDTTLNGSVLNGTSSVDGQVTVTTFTINSTSYNAGDIAVIAGIGTLQINTDGTYAFIPVANFNGPVPAATYTITDGTNGDISTLTITVTPVNDPFTDANEVVSVNEDTTLNGTVLSGTSSVDGPVTVTQFTVDSNNYTAGQTAMLAGIGTLQINANGSYTFIPAANYNGPVPVATYTLTDGDSTDTSTLTITVNPVNDAFTDADEVVSVNEDTTLNGTVLSGTISGDGPVTVTEFIIDSANYTAGQTATLAGIGTLQINANGSYIFIPAANYNGPVPVATYTLTDGDSTDTSTLTITVTPVNDSFTDADEIVSVNEDTTLNGTVLTGTTSGDGPVTVIDFTISGTTYNAGQTATLAGVGTLQINANGTYTFIPAANYNGPVPSALYTLTDGDSTDTSTLTITVTPVNDPFTDANEVVSVNEDTTLNGTVLSGTSSVDGPVTVTDFTISGTTYNAGQTATLAGVGTLQINANGTYTFIPTANYNGPVPVATYTLTDGDSTDTSTLTITVNPVNDPFTDANEVVSVNEDTTLNGTVLSGTSSVDGPVTVMDFTISGTTYNAGQTATLVGVGALQINADGTYTFIPAANYNGPVPVATYTLTDGDSTDTSTLTITVTPINDPFTDANEVVSVNEDTTLNGTVLSGTSSVDGPVTVTDFTISGTTYNAGQTATLVGVGALQINANGTYTFIPTANYNGPVPVATYTLTDGDSTDTSTLTITVTPVNDPFTDANEVVSVNEDTTLNGTVLSGTSSVDGPVTVTDFTISGTTYNAGQTATLAGVGSLQINANGTYTFIPAANYNGPVPVATYTLTDGDSTDISTLTITVTPVNDPFTDANEVVSVNEDTTLNGTVLSGTSSVDGPVTVTDFTISGITYNAGQTATITGVGTLQINADGTYTFIPAANYNGPVPAAIYTLTDGDSTDTSTLTITVNPVNDAFTDANEVVSVNEDTTLNGSVLNGTSSVDGPVTVTQFTVNGTTYAAGQTATIAGIGTLQINANGTYTFIPVANYNGPVPVATYTMTDGDSTDTSTLTITVNPVNDNFTDADELVAIQQNTTLTGTVLSGTSSVDGPVTVTQFTVNGTTYTAGQTATLVGVGTLQINANGAYTFVPATNYNGSVPVATYTMTDGDSTDTSTLTIIVTPLFEGSGQSVLLSTTGTSVVPNFEGAYGLSALNPVQGDLTGLINTLIGPGGILQGQTFENALAIILSQQGVFYDTDVVRLTDGGSGSGYYYNMAFNGTENFVNYQMTPPSTLFGALPLSDQLAIMGYDITSIHDLGNGQLLFSTAAGGNLPFYNTGTGVYTSFDFDNEDVILATKQPGGYYTYQMFFNGSQAANLDDSLLNLPGILQEFIIDGLAYTGTVQNGTMYFSLSNLTNVNLEPLLGLDVFGAVLGHGGDIYSIQRVNGSWNLSTFNVYFSADAMGWSNELLENALIDLANLNVGSALANAINALIGSGQVARYFDINDFDIVNNTLYFSVSSLLNVDLINLLASVITDPLDPLYALTLRGENIYSISRADAASPWSKATLSLYLDGSDHGLGSSSGIIGNLSDNLVEDIDAFSFARGDNNHNTILFTTSGGGNESQVGGSYNAQTMIEFNNGTFYDAFNLQELTNNTVTNNSITGVHVLENGTVLFVLTSTATLPGSLIVHPNDVVAWNGHTFSLYFDGSLHGIPDTSSIDSIYVYPSGSANSGKILMTLDTSASLPGVGTVENQDIVMFNPLTNTYQMMMDGSSLGINDIDTQITINSNLSSGINTNINGLFSPLTNEVASKVTAATTTLQTTINTINTELHPEGILNALLSGILNPILNLTGTILGNVNSLISSLNLGLVDNLTASVSTLSTELADLRTSLTNISALNVILLAAQGVSVSGALTATNNAINFVNNTLTQTAASADIVSNGIDNLIASLNTQLAVGTAIDLSLYDIKIDGLHRLNNNDYLISFAQQLNPELDLNLTLNTAFLNNPALANLGLTVNTQNLVNNLDGTIHTIITPVLNSYLVSDLVENAISPDLGLIGNNIYRLSEGTDGHWNFSLYFDGADHGLDNGTAVDTVLDYVNSYYDDLTLNSLLNTGLLHLSSNEDIDDFNVFELNGALVNGSVANDILVGYASNESFYGGLGEDVMTGNGGANTYLFDAASVNNQAIERDTITDFNPANGDKIVFLNDIFGGGANPLQNQVHASTVNVDGVNSTLLTITQPNNGAHIQEILLQNYSPETLPQLTDFIQVA